MNQWNQRLGHYQQPKARPQNKNKDNNKDDNNEDNKDNNEEDQLKDYNTTLSSLAVRDSLPPL
jgi:hypothetical protein